MPALRISSNHLSRLQEQRLEVGPVLPVEMFIDVLHALAIAFVVTKGRLRLVESFARGAGMAEVMMSHRQRGPVLKPVGDRSGFLDVL